MLQMEVTEVEETRSNEEVPSDRTNSARGSQNPLTKPVTPLAAVWILGTFVLVMATITFGALMLTGGHRLLGIGLVLSTWPILLASGSLAGRRVSRERATTPRPPRGRIERAVLVWNFLLPFGVLVLVGIALARM